MEFVTLPEIPTDATRMGALYGLCTTKEVRMDISAFILSVAFNVSEEVARGMQPMGREVCVVTHLKESVAHNGNAVSQGWILGIHREEDTFAVAKTNHGKYLRFLHFRDGKIHEVTKVGALKAH